MAVCNRLVSCFRYRQDRAFNIKFAQTETYTCIYSEIIFNYTSDIRSGLNCRKICVGEAAFIIFLDDYPVSTCIDEVRIAAQQLAFVHAVFSSRILAEHRGRHKEIYYEQQDKFSRQIERIADTKSDF